MEEVGRRVLGGVENFFLVIGVIRGIGIFIVIVGVEIFLILFL